MQHIQRYAQKFQFKNIIIININKQHIGSGLLTRSSLIRRHNSSFIPAFQTQQEFEFLEHTPSLNSMWHYASYASILLRNMISKSQWGVVTVLGANGNVADEAPAHGCGGCLMTNDASADART